MWGCFCLFLWFFTSVRTNLAVGSLNLHVLNWRLLQICSDCSKHINYKRDMYIHIKLKN